MMLNIRDIRQRYAGMLLGASVALIVWLCGLVGLLAIPEGILYDLLVSLTPETKRVSSSVILVEAPEEERHKGDDTWLSLLRKLKESGTRGAVFTFLPRKASVRFYGEAHDWGRVIFGREIVPLPGESGGTAPESPPQSLPSGSVSTGIATAPPPEHGVYRKQHVLHGTGTALEVQAAHSLSGASSVSLNAPYYVNFLGRRDLPVVHLGRVLSGGLVPELAAGKVAVVGCSDRRNGRVYYTPSGRDLTLLEYQGFALDTLISGRTISEAHEIADLLLLLGIALVFVAVFTHIEFRSALWAAAAVFILAVFLSWMVLAYLHLLLPLAGILLTGGIIVALVLRGRSLSSEASANRMLDDLSVKLRQRFLPETFFDTDEHWSQVITVVDQVLSLNRTIFLEKVEGDHRVREVRALRCSLSDISERRRDYERTPYSTAIQEGGPIRIDSSFSFLKDLPEREDQYLVPLFFGGQTIGFWAFSVDPGKARSIPSFDALVRNFSAQLSELLYRRQLWRMHKIEEERAARGQAGFGDVHYHELRKSLELFERRIVLLESVFSGLRTAVILYDVFGRVLQLNEPMRELAKSRGFAPYDMTALDFAVAVSGQETDEIRRHLYHVILDRRPVSMGAARLSDEGREYLLTMKPLQCGSEAVTSDYCSLGIYGILLEIINTTDVARHCEAGQPKGRQEDGDSVDLSGEVRDAAASLRDECARRGVVIEVNMPALPLCMQGKSGIMRELAEAALRVLSHDAVQESTITVTGVEEGDHISYSFTNTGFGMPGDVFRRYLFDDTVTATEEFLRLRTAVGAVRRWHGDVEAGSEIGAGTHLVVRVRKAPPAG